MSAPIVEQSSDAELARLVTEGTHGPAAEAELCRRFGPRIRLYGLRHLRDEERARDLVQAVLLAVLEALRGGHVKDLDHVDRFMLGTCRNLALRMRHSDTRVVPVDAETLEAVADDVVIDADTVDVGALVRCMSGLDVRAQAVLHLSFYREKTADEIAGVLETTAGNVRVIRHRAVTALRRCLDQPKELGR